MIYSMKRFSRGITLTILMCIVSSLPSNASGQGLFFTPQEIELWRTRAQQGPFRIDGEAWPGSPGDWQRIRNNADGFLSNPESPLTNAKDRFHATINRVGFTARDAAFVYLVTSEPAYGNAVRNWLLTIVNDQSNDIAQLPVVYATLPDGSRNTLDAYFNHAMGVARLTIIYDFAKDSFSTEERSRVETWLLDAAKFFERYTHSGGLNAGQLNYGRAGVMANFPDRKNDNYQNRANYAALSETAPGAWHQLNNIHTEELQPNGTFTCVTTTSSSPLTEIYAYVRADGTRVNRLSVLSQYYNNRRANMVLAFGLIGVLLNDSDLQGEAKRYVKEWLRYSVWPDGSQSEYARNGDYCTEQQGIIYGALSAQTAALLADALARRGDLDLYQYSSVWGLYGSGVSETQTNVPAGSPAKTIWDSLKTHLQLVDGKLQWYQHEAWKTQQEPRSQTHIDGIVEIGQFGPLHTYHESSYLPANRYYRSTLMRDVILRYPPETGRPVFPGTDGMRMNNGFEKWTGATSLFPGLLFMYADSRETDLTTTVWPYPVTDIAVTIAPSSASVIIGDTVTYTLQVTNHGPTVASGISVIDTIPAGMSYASVTANQGSCTGVSTITCNLGSLTNGASATVTIMARATTVGTKTHTATVSNAETDPNPANNTASAITTVLPRCSTGNYKITGAVREDSSDGSRIGGVALKLNGPSCGQIITTGTENYTFTGLKNGSYTLTPSKTGCTFTPASRSVTINNNNVSGWSRTGFAGSGVSCN